MFWSSLTRTIAPADPVISVEDAKTHLNIMHEDDDEYILTLINAATAMIDGPNGIGIALQPQTWRVTLDTISHHFTLPFRPVRSITGITIGAETIAPDLYSFDPDLSSLYCATPIRSTPSARVKIEFEVGYDEVPEDLRHALRMIVAHLYANREAVTAAKLEEVPMAVRTILDRHRVHVA
jgi:uncharacterized phiE125 gp8 family phage protein